jgi:hypothetical protein
MLKGIFIPLGARMSTGNRPGKTLEPERAGFGDLRQVPSFRTVVVGVRFIEGPRPGKKGGQSNCSYNVNLFLLPFRTPYVIVRTLKGA